MFAWNGFGSGLLDSARTILDSGLAVVQNRVELFSAELQEERQRFFRAILYAGALVLFGAVALILFTATIVVAAWESARLAALGGMALLYLLGTVLLYRRLTDLVRKNRPLAGTLDEIKRDRQWLGPGK